MIVSGHITSFYDIDYRTRDDSLLQASVNFVKVSDTVKDNDIGGCYLVLDKKRNVIIRSGMTGVGMKRRCTEHINCSMLTSYQHRTNIIYSSYPNSMCEDGNLSKNAIINGRFQDLAHMVGVGFY